MRIRTTRALTAVTFVFAALAPAARAQDVLAGTLVADPLGVETTRGTFAFATATPLVEQVRSLAKERRSVKVGLKVLGAGRAELASIDGTTSADTDVFASKEVGAAPTGHLRANSPLTIVAAYVETGVGGKSFVWLKASSGATRGWIPGSLVTVGTQHRLGGWLGRVLAPVFSTVSSLRNSRTFHPDGACYTGTVRSLSPAAPLDGPAKRLEGSALLRVGAGTWKRGIPGGVSEWLPDALSMAIRFRAPGAPLAIAPAAGDQDLLATAYLDRLRHLGSILWKGDKNDYFDNLYFAAEPFEVAPGLEVWVRLVPVAPALADPTLAQPKDPAARERKLLTAVQEGKALFRIEVQKVDPSFSKEWLGVDIDKWWSQGWSAARKEEPWVAIAELRFEKKVDVDQEKLKFHPDLAGRGFTPHGVVAGIRPAVYRASSDARPESEEERKRRESEGLIERLRHSNGGN